VADPPRGRFRRSLTKSQSTINYRLSSHALRCPTKRGNSTSGRAHRTRHTTDLGGPRDARREVVIDSQSSMPEAVRGFERAAATTKSRQSAPVGASRCFGQAEACRGEPHGTRRTITA
jgi:hypothetical protein